MRAIVVEEYGGPEVLTVRDWPEPEPGPGEVSIAVRYAGMNFTDVRNRLGDGLGRVPFIPGVEAAGHIRKVGPGVEGLAVGQPVAAFTRGSAYAEVVTALAPLTVALPEPLAERPDSGGMLVTIPVVLALFRQAGSVGARDMVLLNSAAGGVGTAAVQIAAHEGLQPLLGTVGSPEKAKYAMDRGFAKVFTYDELPGDLMEYTGGKGVDVVLDPIGGSVRAACFELLAPFGRLVHYSNVSREPEEVPSAEWLRARCVSYIGYSGGQLTARSPELMRPYLEEAVQLVASGAVDVGVTQVLALTDVAVGHQAFGDRTARGKIILAT